MQSATIVPLAAAEPPMTAKAELYTALANAQNAIGKIFKNATNPHFGNSYVDLAGLMDYVQPVLYEHGLVIFHVTEPARGEYNEPLLITYLVHTATGQSIISRYPLRAKDLSDPQKLGATVTYARRYSIMAILGLAPEDDDDGNYAAGHTEKLAAPTKKAAPAKSATKGKGSPNKPASDKQREFIINLLDQTGYVTASARDKRIKELVRKNLDEISSADASTIIDALQAEKASAKGDDSLTPPF